MAASEARVLFDRARPAELEAERGLVTVAVSLFRYRDVIVEALESVGAQTHPRLELVIVDDQSQDGSAEAASAWLETNSDRFERALLLQPAANLGLSDVRNLAFEHARSEHVFVLDADNVLLPRAISRLDEVMGASGAAAAYSQIVYFGAGEGLGAADVWDPERFRRDNYVDAMALVRRSAWRAVGGYSRLEYGWEDYDFWCKFVEAGLEGVFVPELLCRYRVHAASMLRTDTAAQRGRLTDTMMARHPWLDLRA